MIGASDRESSRTPAGGAILLVEDERGIREIEFMLLGRHGYRVLPAEGVVPAQQLFLAHQHDIRLLLTDLVLPDGSGLDLFRQLNVIKPGLAALFVSGGELSGIEMPARSRFIRKPFGMGELERQVLLAMSEAGPHRPAPPVCGLSHRVPAPQLGQFQGENQYLCYDSRECPYQSIRKRQSYCTYQATATDE